MIGGDAGYMSGFMYQKGVLVICGDVDAGIGDSMYAGDIFVGGDLGTPGSDCVEKELTAADEALLATLCEPYGLGPKRGWTKLGSGGKLHNFDRARVRDLAGGDVTERDAIEARRWLHHHAVWTPDVIEDIQLKAELGRYRYRGMSTHAAGAELRRPDVPHLHALARAARGLPRALRHRRRCSARGSRSGRCELKIPITVCGMCVRRAVAQRQGRHRPRREPGGHVDDHRRRRHAPAWSARTPTV